MELTTRGRVRSVDELRTRAVDPDGDFIVTVNLTESALVTEQLSFVLTEGQQPPVGTEVEVTIQW